MIDRQNRVGKDKHIIQRLLGVFDFKLRKYRRLRDVGNPLMTRIADGVPKELFIRAGEDLGLSKNSRTFVLKSRNDCDFVMDRAIHDILWEGKRWIERVCDEDIGKYQPEEQAMLKAHRAPAFSLYEVMAVSAGRGVLLKDLFDGRELFLIDLGLGATGSKGLVIATRVISHRDIHFTAGVTMAYRPERVKSMIERLSALYREQENTPVWKETMRNQVPALFREYRKGEVEVEFAPVTHAPAGPPRAETGEADKAPQAPEEERPLPGRNAPCPCGSGKKYKKCCLPGEDKTVRETAWSYAKKKQLIQRSDDFPVYFCYINPCWQEVGLARIMIARAHESGRLIISSFLVDIFCLGIKSAFCNADVPADKFETEALRSYGDQKPMTIGIHYAREIVFGALEYAGGLGFKPHPDFNLACCVLGREEPPGSRNIRFGGPDGKPMYIAGPDDDVPVILKKLRKRLGEGGFEFCVPATDD